MTPERKSVWLAVFAAFNQVWSFLDPTPDRLTVWDAALGDLDEYELVHGAAHVIATHNSYPPVPADIRDGALGRLEKRAVTRVDGKIIRWEEKREGPEHAPNALVALLDSFREQVQAQGQGRLTGRPRALPAKQGLAPR